MQRTQSPLDFLVSQSRAQASQTSFIITPFDNIKVGEIKEPPLEQHFSDVTLPAETTAAPGSSQGVGTHVHNYPPQQVFSQPTPQPQQEQPSEQTQKLSYVPSGKVPSGYAPSKSCATCQHFSSYDSVCWMHDFPCSAQYVCDSYVWEHEEVEVDILSGLNIALSDLSEGDLIKLSDAYSGVDVDFDLVRGHFPIVNKETAQTALDLRDKLDAKRRRRLLKECYSFIPQEVDKVRNEVASFEPTKEPANKGLWTLVTRSKEASNKSKEELLSTYETLFKQNYSDASPYVIHEEVTHRVQEETTQAEPVIVVDAVVAPKEKQEVPDTMSGILALELDKKEEPSEASSEQKMDEQTLANLSRLALQRARRMYQDPDPSEELVAEILRNLIESRK